MSHHTFDGNNKVRQLIALATQGTVSSSWVSPFATSGASGDANRAVFLVWVGTIGSGVTLTAKLRQAKDSVGTSAEDIVGATITIFGETTDERFRTIEIGPGLLKDSTDFNHVQLVVTAAGGTAIYGGMLINHWLRFPGVGGQHTSYDEQKIVLG